MAEPLTRERITLAALSLVDEEGLDKLSMRKVASRLGVEAMSLYRHVANKGDLLDALHDHLVGQVPPPGAGPWEDRARGLATAFREVLFLHPRAVPLLATRPAATPAALAVLDHGIAVFTEGGWEEAEAVVAFQTLFCFVVGHGVFHTAAGSDTNGARAEFQEGLEIVLAGLRAARV